ncbi:MAG: hypothetical protein LT070_00335, partial [Solirubrobacteraceae bacterium]|nr:hypothetical protein [Solirubrobacteraceae bacterium]
GAGALVGAVLTMLPDGAPAGAPVVAAAAAVATGALPRVGWLLSVLAAVVSLAIAGSPGSALLVSAAALPCVLLMRSPALWSAPLLAVLLGLGGLALAWVALAGQASGWLRRASLGALGLWWLTLAELLTGRALLFTAPPAGAPPAGWERSLAAAGGDVLTPLVSGPTLAACALWALAAAVLPWLVRGSRLAFDLVAAAAWTAAVAAGTAAIAAVELRGALAGAVLAAALALAGATARAARAPSSDVWADTAGEWADTI